ncbi:unnamed protein product, partial [Closterium sp. Naga37s-1]
DAAAAKADLPTHLCLIFPPSSCFSEAIIGFEDSAGGPGDSLDFYWRCPRGVVVYARGLREVTWSQFREGGGACAVSPPWHRTAQGGSRDASEQSEAESGAGQEGVRSL